MDARWRVHEISCEQALHSGAAGLRHGRRGVALLNLGVAFRASFIPQMFLRREGRWPSFRRSWSLLREHGGRKYGRQ